MHLSKRALTLLLIIISTVTAACGAGFRVPLPDDTGMAAAETAEPDIAEETDTAEEPVEVVEITDPGTRMGEALAILFTFDPDAIGPYVCDAQREAVQAAIEDSVADSGLTEDILADLSVDISDLEYDVQIDGTEATVDISGELTVEILGQTQVQDGSDLFPRPVTMILEDDAWVICDNILIDQLGS
jgi:hypothetical protein